MGFRELCNNVLAFCRMVVIPLTSLMTVGVVSMISYAYLKYFLPVISKRHEINEIYVP